MFNSYLFCGLIYGSRSGLAWGGAGAAVICGIIIPSQFHPYYLSDAVRGAAEGQLITQHLSFPSADGAWSADPVVFDLCQLGMRPSSGRCLSIWTCQF